MKRNDLLKAIGIGFLVLVVLTWIVVPGVFSSGVFTAASSTEPLGFFNILKAPISTIGNYATYGLYILAIGGLYGVLKATGAYDTLVDGLVKVFNKNRKKFLIITTILFTVLSAFTSLQFILLILVPVFVAVLLGLGYSKLSALMATFGAILVGNIGSVYGFNVAGYLNYYFSLDINANIWFKLALFVILVALLIFFIIKHEESKDKKETKVVKTEKKSTKKVSKKAALVKEEKVVAKTHVSTTPMIVLMIILILVLLVGCYNWSYGISFKGFETLYTSIKEVTWASNLIGTVDPIGYWSISEGISLILVTSLIIGWVYRLKFKDIVNAFIRGARTLVSTAILVSLASIIIYCVLGASSGNNIFFTTENAILGLSSSFNALQAMLSSVVGGLFVNDFTYFVGYMSTPLKTVFTDSNVYGVLTLIMQTMHGITMLVLPTSVMLVAGLSYLNIPYKDYLKYIWKFVLEVLIAVSVVIALVCIFM